MPEIRTCITGTRFTGRAGMVAVERLRAGDPVLLRRDPINPHDRNAVLCLSEHDIRLGFVPRITNPRIAAALDSGRQVVAVVHETADIRRGFVKREAGITVSWEG